MSLGMSLLDYPITVFSGCYTPKKDSDFTVPQRVTILSIRCVGVC